MTRRICKSGPVPFSILYKDYVLSAECGVLFPTYIAMNISLHQRSFVSSHTPDHGRERSSDSPRHAHLLRRVSADVLQHHSRLGAVVLEVVADELASYIRPQPLDANSTRNHHGL